MKIHQKPERKKTTEREKFHYVNGTYNRVMDSGERDPFLVRRDPLFIQVMSNR